MDELLKIFLSWQFMIFCLGLAALGFVMRKIIEYAILDNPHVPGNKHSMIWRSLILPIAPVVSGALAGYFAKNYPYPDGLGSSEYGRISFGLVAGLLSGLVYRVVAELLKSKMAQGYVAGAMGQPLDPTMTQDVTQNIQVTMPTPPSTTTLVVTPNMEPSPQSVLPNMVDPATVATNSLTETVLTTTPDGKGAAVTPEGVITTAVKPTDS